jgi:uncharacterized protein
MAIAPTYPGVYIEELPSGTRTIVGVASSIAAFVGYTARGLDHRAIRVQSFADFGRFFGGLDAESELGYAVQQFFLNGGTDAFVVRVPKHDAVAARVDLKDGVDGSPNVVLTAKALSKGAWANWVRMDVDYDGISGDAKAFNLTVTDLRTGVTERFDGVTMDTTQRNFVESVVNDVSRGSSMISLTAVGASGRPAETGTVGGDITLNQIVSDKTYSVKVTVDVPAGGISALTVNVVEQGEALPTSIAGLASLVERKLNRALGAALPGARVTVRPSASGKGLRVAGDFDPELLPGALDASVSFTAGEPNDLLAALKLAGAGVKPNVGGYLLGKGRAVLGQAGAVAGVDGTQLPNSADLIGDEAAYTGIQALRRVDLFNILCIPDATRALPGNPNALDTTVSPNAIFAAAQALCAERRAMLVVDPPPDVRDPRSALDWITSGLTAKGPDAAAYFPRVRVPDPLDDFRPRSVAPSGTVAGLWARTDASRGVWKAPAGVDARLVNVAGLVYQLTDAENGVLNPLGLNCLRTLPVYSTISWGARTLEGADRQASQWKYLPIRRVAKMIEESVYRGSQWAVFEPNDEPLWSQLRLNLTSYMHGLFRQGAFQGATPREAYLVKCDAQTTTQDDIDRGIVNVVVGFAPLKPAEFVIIRIQQLAGQTQS